MVLEPREYFTPVRQIENHLDTGTYYVRATIRNARTDALIERVPLVHQGDQRYSTPWQVPADTSGLGFYIVITTEVFTDAGFTTKSGDYGDKSDTYKIEARIKNGGGGGVDIDYKKIEKIITSALAEREKTIIAELLGLSTAIKSIDIPKTDLAPVMEYLGKVAQAVQGITIEPTDLSSVISEIKTAQNAILALPQQYEIDETISKLEDVAEKISDHSGKINEMVSGATREILKTAEEIIDTNEQIVGIVQNSVETLHNRKLILTPEEKIVKKSRAGALRGIGGVDTKVPTGRYILEES